VIEDDFSLISPSNRECPSLVGRYLLLVEIASSRRAAETTPKHSGPIIEEVVSREPWDGRALGLGGAVAHAEARGSTAGGSTTTPGR
jgi:hypothetical protein